MRGKLQVASQEKCSIMWSDTHIFLSPTYGQTGCTSLKLNFACRAKVPGRAFLRCLINATCNLKAPQHRVRIANSLKEDLKVWLSFLRTHNGATMIVENWNGSGRLDLYTDAAGGVGFGAFCQGHWALGA